MQNLFRQFTDIRAFLKTSFDNNITIGLLTSQKGGTETRDTFAHAESTTDVIIY